ncbi:MAG: sulfocyanin-like copper-binding protein [Actinobacteria bacterium]|nr:sulfocyanin-like copper-binding protein [Actinomycetota bacterium]
MKDPRFMPILLASVLIFSYGCGEDNDDTAGGSDSDGAITGVVKEWKVKVDQQKATAGEVVFTVTNEGTIGHEFLVVKTDVADGEIELDGDHFSEENASLLVIDEIGEFAKKTTESLTVTLEPGDYQLVCNLPGHYENGMHTSFTVTS